MTPDPRAGFKKAVDEIRKGNVDLMVVATRDILTVREVVDVVEAGGGVAFADSDVVLGRIDPDTLDNSA